MPERVTFAPKRRESEAETYDPVGGIAEIEGLVDGLAGRGDWQLAFDRFAYAGHSLGLEVAIPDLKTLRTRVATALSRSEEDYPTADRVYLLALQNVLAVDERITAEALVGVRQVRERFEGLREDARVIVLALNEDRLVGGTVTAAPDAVRTKNRGASIITVFTMTTPTGQRPVVVDVARSDIVLAEGKQDEIDWQVDPLIEARVTRKGGDLSKFDARELQKVVELLIAYRDAGLPERDDLVNLASCLTGSDNIKHLAGLIVAQELGSGPALLTRLYELAPGLKDRILAAIIGDEQLYSQITGLPSSRRALRAIAAIEDPGFDTMDGEAQRAVIDGLLGTLAGLRDAHVRTNGRPDWRAVARR